MTVAAAQMAARVLPILLLEPITTAHPQRD